MNSDVLLQLLEHEHLAGRAREATDAHFL